MEKKIRIKDIAKMANVSVGTVDRVIHNRGEVAPDSYNRVMAILEKTGYKPNLLARTLGTHKNYRIAAIIPNPRQDEYWSFSYEGIQQAAEQWSQYAIQVKPFHFDLYEKNSFVRAAEEALQSSPDGILLAPIFHQESIQFFKECSNAKVPFVLFNNNIEEAGALSFVGQDLNQSGRLGAELLHCNERKPGTYAILHIYDDVQNSVHLFEKEKGFKEYFHSEPGEFNVKSIDLNYTHEPTLENELNDLLSDKDLKGLLVTTSKGANIVSRLLEKHGKNGIRLVAYDMLKENLHYLNRGTIDFLINQNSKRQAFMGIGHLSNYLLFKKEAPQKYLFPLEIISRQNLQSYLQLDMY